jgi:acyl carrier protein
LTGVLGNPSQANYSAGGTFQDAFAKHLTGKGIPAVCIDLGSIKSVGYVAQNEGVEERLKKMGYDPIEEETLLRIIESAIRKPYRPREACQVITRLALPDEDRKAFWDVERRFGPLAKSSASDGESGHGKERAKAVDDFKTLLPKTISPEEATDVVVKGIVGKISEMFNIPEVEIDSAQPVGTYGIDSLVAVEIRNWLSSRAKADISIFDVLQSKSVRAVAEKVALKSQYVGLRA